MDNYTGKIQFFWCKKFKYTCVALPADDGGPGLTSDYTLIGESEVINVDLKVETPEDVIELLEAELIKTENDGKELAAKIQSLRAIEAPE